MSFEFEAVIWRQTMPQIINTNILAINAQRQLNKTSNMQTTAIERLSSGLRINSAKDDAAGLAISTRFETQVRGLNQAVRNANDGISLAQTAEGSMQEMSNILQRMRELSVQSANGTNSDADRASIQAEVDQLYDELERIAESTEFNGVKLLDGSSSSKTFQIGANANQNISFNLESVTAQDLNLNGFSALGELNGGRINGDTLFTGNTSIIDAGDITINGVALGSFDTGSNKSIDDVETLINDKTGLTGVTAEAYNVITGGGGVSGVTTGALVVNGASVTKSGSITELVDNINRDVAGITAKISSSGELILSNDTGNTITVASASASDLSAAGLTAGTYFGYLSLESADGEEIDITYDATSTNVGAIADVQLLGFNTSTGSDNVTGGAVSGTFISAADGIEINGVQLGAVQNGTSAAVTSSDIAFSINAISSSTGVTADARTEEKYEIQISNLAAGVTFTINQVTITTLATTATTMQEFVSLINGSNVQGVVATTEASTGKLVLTSEGGLDLEVLQTANDIIFDYTTAASGSTTRGVITLTGEDGKDVLVTSAATTQASQTAALTKLGFVAQGGDSTAIGLTLDVSTAANASNAIDRIDEALDKISSSRADLGAIQNRLASTISNLENVTQSLSAANSRIRDADFASETSDLTKSQILQQAGIAMLAQANASQQSVLSLLG